MILQNAASKVVGEAQGKADTVGVQASALDSQLTAAKGQLTDAVAAEKQEEQTPVKGGADDSSKRSRYPH